MEILSTASHPLSGMGRRSHGVARACSVFFNLLPLLALCFAPEAFSQGAKEGPLPEAPLKVIPERVPAKPETTPKSESKSEPAA